MDLLSARSSVQVMDWTAHGERTLYSSRWVSFGLIDTELPNGRRFDHEVVRAPGPAAGTVVFDAIKGVLLLWRHRFITGSRGWEIPAGRVEQGETPAQGAAREVLEETGWRVGQVKPLFAYHPSSGMVDQTFHVFFADDAVHETQPADWFESDRIEWVSLDDICRELAAGRVSDGLTVTALSWALVFGPLAAMRRETGT